MSAKKKSKSKSGTAVAIHAAHTDGLHHVVGFGNLRVIICVEDGFYFAQGLELDYGAQGDSLEDVKEQFEDGLMATVQEHLKIYGSIEKMLKQAPEETWKEILTVKSKSAHRFSQVTTHEVRRELPKHFQENLAFEGISYIQLETAA